MRAGELQRWVESGAYAKILAGDYVRRADVKPGQGFKDDVKEVKEGYECGIAIENFNDIKVGDTIECFTVEEIKRQLD